SVNGCRVQVHGKNVQNLIAQGHASVRFTPLSGGDVATLPVQIRNSEKDGEAIAIGCLYLRSQPDHHRYVADLIFANADQWTQFQQTRRRNPGVLLGTVWFLRLAMFQTIRGLVYLFRGVNSQEDTTSAKTAEART